jgi:tetratricopeptide (TPR) repeat protein
VNSEEIDALWHIDDAASGYDRLLVALRDHPESADELHTQICRALGLQRRFDEARAELAQISTKPSEIVRVRTALEFGRLANSSGDKFGAKPFFLEALEGAKQSGFDFYAVDAAHMLGIVTEGPESVEWNETAIQMAKASDDPRAQRWQGSLLNNLGWTYHEAGEYESALTKFQEALQFQERFGNDVKIRIAKWMIARCLRSLKRYDEAIEIQSGLLDQGEEGYASEEMGELLLATGHPDQAKPHFLKAYELLSQDIWLQANETARLQRLRDLSV